MKKLYPYEDVGQNVAVQLKSKQIKLSTGKVDGWSYDLHHQQVCEIIIYKGHIHSSVCTMPITVAF